MRFIAGVFVLVADVALASVIDDAKLIEHLEHFFSSWVKKDHGGMGSVKHVSKMGID